MLERMKEFIKEFSKIYVTLKFLVVIAMICFIMIASSMFNEKLDATGNLVTIRTVFSSIIGSILEKTSRKVLCRDRVVKFKNYTIGILAISITVLIALTEIAQVDVNNPSVILLKNMLFSSIGFLISATKSCEQDNSLKEN